MAHSLRQRWQHAGVSKFSARIGHPRETSCTVHEYPRYAPRGWLVVIWGEVQKVGVIHEIVAGRLIEGCDLPAAALAALNDLLAQHAKSEKARG